MELSNKIFEFLISCQIIGNFWFLTIGKRAMRFLFGNDTLVKFLLLNTWPYSKFAEHEQCS
jgi:hypothetical protein